MEKIITGVILSALFLALVSAGTVRADEAIPDLSMGSAPVGELYYMDAEPGRIDSTGIYFEVKDSEWLNISVASSELIKLTLESLPNMITMHLSAAAGAASTQITIGGLAPGTTYHKYEDNYHNHEEFTTDDNGTYTYSQDLSVPHIVFIQTQKSTKFIKDDATGGDCYSIGIWDYSTKTCTLTMDLNETIQIDSDNVTLDGNGHTLTGSGTGNGVFLWYKTGVIIQNLNINGFSNGITLRASNNNILTGINASNNKYGVYLWGSFQNTIMKNAIYGTTPYKIGYGILIEGSSFGNTVSKNIVSGYSNGIAIVMSSDSTISGNYTTSNARGIYFLGFGNNTLVDNISNFNINGIVIAAGGNVVLRNNIMNNNDYNMSIRANNVTGGDIDISNLVDGKPVYYIKNASNQTYDASTNAGVFYCLYCNNVTVEGLTLSKNSDGVVFYNTYNSTIQNVVISNNRTGISLIKSSNNNNIYNNNFIENDTGIDLNSSDNNIIYNNNFINNYTRQAYAYGGSNNIFYLPAPIGGNYWSDYDTSAEGCYDNNGDGFCDVPYVFTGGQDSLPLTKGNPTDTIAPTTTISLSGTPGNNGWYLSDVQVTLTATDNDGGSGVAKTEYSFDGMNWTTYSTPLMVNTEGTTTVYYKSSDSAGNAETAKSLAVSIDKTPPSITGAATTSPNANGWYNTDVVVQFTASDNVSGIDTITPDTIISSEGANQSVTGTAFDMAGNSASATVSGINIDKTAPVIAITSPAAIQYDHSATINISFSVTDNVSGVYKTTVYLGGQQYEPANPISLINLSLGIHTLKVESETYAGLTATQAVDFEIIATAGGTTSLVTTLYQTGAIDSAGMVTSLTQQLQAAQAAISSGQTVAAQNILEAFINMLEAQSGQHISSSAVEILKADTVYMIGQL